MVIWWGMFPSPRGVELHKPSGIRYSLFMKKVTGFRPLAGLSCINHISPRAVYDDVFEFPSPRGVELHKPGWTVLLLVQSLKFPSPRGVELHKPR